VEELPEWRNGNLVVSVEPSESGQRLSLHTRKSDVTPFLAMGVGMIVIAAVLFVVSAVGGDLELRSIRILSLLGVAGVGVNLARLPFWSRTRARQMEEIAAAVMGWTAPPPREEGDDPPRGSGPGGLGGPGGGSWLIPTAVSGPQRGSDARVRPPNVAPQRSISDGSPPKRGLSIARSLRVPTYGRYLHQS
jgi:hypothetical protein